jgi:ribose 5-phosphate isomerase A
MNQDGEKRLAAARAVALVEDGMALGLGTGSTAAHAVALIGLRVQEGLRVRGVPTSESTARLAREAGIPLIGLGDVEQLDLTLDGADEIDGNLRCIKGGGGALLREKIVAAASKRMVVMCDASKQVATLGRFPLPVEVIPFAAPFVKRRLEALGARVTLRGGEAAFVTDEKHHILDAAFGRIDDPQQLATILSATPGVVEHGLFIGLAQLAVIGDGDGTRIIDRARPTDAA